MKINEVTGAGYLVHELHGRLDAGSADIVKQKLLTTLQQASQHLVIDCAGLQYISSIGLRVLLVATKQASTQHVRLVLCNLTEMVRQVFDLAGFGKVIPHYASRAEAVAALATFARQA
jgi:anti-anti-sigma factor